MVEKIKGYKVFNSDWTCRDFQYEVGKTFTHKGEIELCGSGFHFCKELKDCFSYYNFDSNNKVAEILAIGNTITGDDKSVTDKIKIVKELSWYDVLTMVNIGKDNTGFLNSGNCNSGDWNSGNRNSGDWNSGNRNSGNCNSGNRNSGNRNSGDWNSGDCNSGNRNSGNRNSGNRNSGDWNSGDCNSGMFNSCDYSNGLFNTKSPKISLFNKPTKMTFEEFKVKHNEAFNLLYYSKFNLTEWIDICEMSGEEKVKHPEYKTLNGYLKQYSYKEACQNVWDNFTKQERNKIKKLPNFDKDIFFDITGIKV